MLEETKPVEQWEKIDRVEVDIDRLDIEEYISAWWKWAGKKLLDSELQ